MESIYGAGFWSVCHRYNVRTAFPDGNERNEVGSDCGADGVICTSNTTAALASWVGECGWRTHHSGAEYVVIVDARSPRIPRRLVALSPP